MITFYGMGLLGTQFVRASLRRGEQVQVWNRTSQKAQALEAEGAEAFADPSDAARGAARVHLVLSDDRAVDEVLDKVVAALSPGAAIVDHTTTSPEGTRARAARFAERGIVFQHAPVFMGPQNAFEASGMMLASGDKGQFDALAPALSQMTGKLLYLGREPERAASFKLLGNSYLMFLTAGLADFFGLAKSFGITPTDAASLFQHFNPGAAIPGRVERILSGASRAPTWELKMARKDARLMLESAEKKGVPLALLPAIAKEMDRFIERGFGEDDWTVIARDAIEP